jgi:asparagine synthase (glutamine-hydrolysing)
MEAVDSDEDALFSRQVRSELPDGFMSWSPLARAQYLESTIFMSEYLLCSQGDRMSMAHSVEGRFPFLDHRLIELASELVPPLKVQGLREKRILKKIASDLIPSEIVGRVKHPFRAPIQSCFLPAGRALEWVDEVASRRAVEAAGLFDPDAVGHLLSKAARARALGEMDEMALVGVLSAQLLHRLFIGRVQQPEEVGGKDALLTVIRGGASRQMRGSVT